MCSDVCPSLLENCLLPGTDYVRGQIFENTFAANGCYCFYIVVVARFFFFFFFFFFFVKGLLQRLYTSKASSFHLEGGSLIKRPNFCLIQHVSQLFFFLTFLWRD